MRLGRRRRAVEDRPARDRSGTASGTYAKGPKRRPVRIEFCEADILDLFDGWRRAVGVSATTAAAGEAPAPETSPRKASLASHIERVVARLTGARAGGRRSSVFDAALAAAVRELDGLVPDAGRARGEGRTAIVEQLARIDREVLGAALQEIDATTAAQLRREGDAELAPFGSRMAPEARARAAEAAYARLVRDAFGIPVIEYRMSLTAGQEIDVDIEKPAAGGRMIARHEGQIVLVLGGIPGERVRAVVERADKRLAFATLTRILEPSPDRREPAGDPLCGGCLYASIAYQRQRRLKSDIVADAFARLGRIPLDYEVPVAASPTEGYRIRARLHVRGSRVGFYREGTHDLCDAASTGQLADGTLASVEAAAAALHDAGVEARAVEVSENIAADERALCFELAGGGPELDAAFAGALAAGRLTGCTGRTPDGTFVFQGVPEVTDPLAVLTAGRAVTGSLGRGPESFFQANRFLLPSLVTTVIDAVPAAGVVLDLYAGVGLFSIALAATGHDHIIAVEGDRASGRDLRRNAREWPAVRATISGVEEFLAARRHDRADTILVDPPRTGLSKEAMAAIVRHGATHLVYVSCDPPTMARDARRLLDAGYLMGPLTAFDLFPNTPHVETVGVFERLRA